MIFTPILACSKRAIFGMAVANKLESRRLTPPKGVQGGGKGRRLMQRYKVGDKEERKEEKEGEIGRKARSLGPIPALYYRCYSAKNALKLHCEHRGPHTCHHCFMLPFAVI